MSIYHQLIKSILVMFWNILWNNSLSPNIMTTFLTKFIMFLHGTHLIGLNKKPKPY
jgi:uncharacterized protein YhhL (DUF1145 family)